MEAVRNTATGLENLHVTSFNGVKVYHCTPSKSDHDWGVSDKRSKSKALKKNNEYQSRLTIIHDFAFPACANRVKVSPDGQFVAATGTYKPTIKLYDLEQMSLKVQRSTDEESQQLQFLSDDYSKFVVARLDRILEFHSSHGLHTTVRTPRHIRDISYHRPTCDLFVASNANEVFRLNLDQGAFQTSITTGFNETNGGITAIGLNPVYPMLGVCGYGGVETWDLRDRSSAGYLDILNTLSNPQLNSNIIGAQRDTSIASLLRTIQNSKTPLETTAIRYNDDTGMEVSIGLSTGHVVSFDLRSPRPMCIYDHRYNLPIHSVKYHTQSRTLITSDKKTIRLWDYTNPDLTHRHLTTITSPAPINDMTMVPGTGMLFTACDHPNMQTYFIPRLGTVPNWAASLEAFTEELDNHQQASIQKQHHLLASGYTEMDAGAVTDLSDVSQTVFDGYKFITREDLDKMGFSHLTTQSNMLKPYMHGYLVTTRLHEQLYEMVAMNKLEAGASEEEIMGLKETHGVPESEVAFIQKEIHSKLSKQRDSGFKMDSIPSVNKDYAISIAAREQLPNKKQKTKKSEMDAPQEQVSLLQDDRFADLFRDSAFAIDATSEDYKRLHPTLKASMQADKPDADPDADPDDDIDMLKAPKPKDKIKDKKKKQPLEGHELANQQKMKRDNQQKRNANLFAQTVAAISKSTASQSRLSALSSRSSMGLSTVKRGVGVVDVLNNGRTAGARGKNQMLSLADRIRVDEQDKLARETAYAQEQIQLKREQKKDQAQQQSKASEGRRKVNKNVY